MFQTFLSEEIYNFIKLCGTQHDSTSNEFIFTDLTVNWIKIESLFLDCTDESFVIHNQTEEWFRLKIKLIHQIISEASYNFNNASDKIIFQLWDRSLWCDRLLDLKKCYDYFRSNVQSELLKSVLILTSIIERALGNVYKIDNKNVPFLLKDLLETKYLSSLFGKGPIRLMQILFGTSKALNLRNITWHGFLSLNELNQNHVAILFIIIASLGDILKEQHIELTNIPYRYQISNLEQKLNEIEARNKFINLFMFPNELHKIIDNSNILIGPTHLDFWGTIIRHNPENCNNNCVILLLPIFEHLLRRIFCKINCCNDRNLIALQKEKYITLDEIFAEKFEEKPNKIFEVLNQGAIDFYNDLFSHLSGPRIRDKFSHGEIILQSVPCRLTELLQNLIVYCLLQTNKFEDFDFKKELNINFDSYEGIYNPNTILKYKILDAWKYINKLLNIPKPNENEIEKIEIQFENFVFNKIIDECIKILNSNLKIYVENKKIPTLHRPKQELKLVKKLTKITDKIIDISEQIISDNETRYKSFIDHTLGSRQINKYDEILQSISVVYDSLNCILHIVVLLIHKQFSQNEENFHFDKHIFRFLQSTLNYEDKIERFSNVKLNKWMKVRTLTSGYEKQVNYIYEKHMKNV